MADTNWCTFCDCAINPCSNFVYCSEECYRKDALTHQSFYPGYDVPQQIMKAQANVYIPSQQHQSFFDPVMLSPPPEFNPSRRESASSVSSEDLAAMYFDMIPQTPPLENNSDNLESSQKSTPSTPPLLSSSTSPTSSVYEDVINMSESFSYSLPVQEKSNLLLPLTSYENICMTHSTRY